MAKKFDPKKLDKLNDPERLKELPPDFILEKAGVEDPKVIIDLGAGTGFFSISLVGIFSRCTLYACDISEIMINWMRKHVSPKYANIIPLKMEESQVPLENEIADFLLMINLHHELDHPEKTLLECHRLLKPGGKIAISDWQKKPTEHGPPLALRCEPEVVKAQLQAAGFNQVRIYMELPNNFLLVAEKGIKT